MVKLRSAAEWDVVVRRGVAVKSLYSQMHRTAEIIFHSEDDVIALTLQKGRKEI